MTYWVNIYSDHSGWVHPGASVFESEHDAMLNATAAMRCHAGHVRAGAAQYKEFTYLGAAKLEMKDDQDTAAQPV